MTSSVFSQIALAPADPILGLTEAFNADTNSAKVNLGVGVYQDGSGKVPILEVVKEAERQWQALAHAAAAASRPETAASRYRVRDRRGACRAAH